MEFTKQIITRLSVPIVTTIKTATQPPPLPQSPRTKRRASNSWQRRRGNRDRKEWQRRRRRRTGKSRRKTLNFWRQTNKGDKNKNRHKEAARTEVWNAKTERKRSQEEWKNREERQECVSQTCPGRCPASRSEHVRIRWNFNKLFS